MTNPLLEGWVWVVKADSVQNAVSLGLMKKQVPQPDPGQHPDKIGDESGDDGVAGVFDAHGAKVQGYDIQRGIRRTLENTHQPPDERIGAELLHGVDHQGAGAAAAQGFHQGYGQGIGELGVETGERKQELEAIDQVIHRATGAEGSNGYQHPDEVGDDHDRRAEPILGPLDEGVEHVDFFVQSPQKKRRDDEQQDRVSHHDRHRFDLFFGKLREKIKSQRDESRQSAQAEHHRAIEQVEPLPGRRNEHTDHGGDVGTHHAGNEHIGWTFSPENGALGDDTQRDNLQTRRVQDQKHDLGVGGRVGIGVEGLQALHRFQAEGRGGIIQADHVGGKIHDHLAVGGVVAGYLRKKLIEKRANDAGQHVDGSGFFTHIEDTQKERHNARQRQGDVHHGYLGHVEHPLYHEFESQGIAQEDELDQRDNEGNDKEENKNVV